MTSNSNHAGLKAFFQHGFIAAGTSGTQTYGRCPFCGKDRHFYVNPENKAWDCKRCGENGGFQTFLDKVAAMCRGTMGEEETRDLVTSRGLAPETFERFGVGYNHLTNAYTVPVWDMAHEHVWDLRIYKEGKLLSTASCHTGLYGWWGLSEPFELAFICEGEWDAMALSEVVGQRPGILITAVPGAGTFKAEWIAHFKDKAVVVLYDHDKAGRDGAQKVFNLLKQSTSDLKFLHWPKEKEEGYDVRDLYVKEFRHDSKKTFDFILTNLHELPPGATEETLVQTTKKAVDTAVAKLTGPGALAEDVYKTYRKWLLLPDIHVLDFMFGVVIANRLPGDPIWAHLVGPSGATKTELLVSLKDSPLIETVSSLTPHSLVSGANFSGGGDPSLIPKWNGKVVIIKDFTLLMNTNPLAREEIFGIFRECYEGLTEKGFGNGVYRRYESKFGLMTGVTPIIEIFLESHSALGERFLRYPVYVPDTIEGKMEITRRAMNNTLSEDEMRSELRAIASMVLNYKFPTIPTIPKDIAEKVIHLSQFVEVLRGTITRDNFTKEITHRPFGAFATRIAKQFSKLLMGIGMFRRLDVIDQEAFEVIRKIAVGTIPTRLHELLHAFYRKGPEKSYTLADAVSFSKLPQVTVQRLLDGLVALDAVKRIPTGMRTEWKINPEIIHLIKTSGVYDENANYNVGKRSLQSGEPRGGTGVKMAARKKTVA